MERKPSYSEPLSGASLTVNPVGQEPVSRVADGIKFHHILRLADQALQHEKGNPATFQKRRVPQRQSLSHRLHTNRGVHPLCYEHHIEMERVRVNDIPNARKKPAQMASYACLEPGCSVGYNGRWGYAMKREHSERDVMPRVSCPRDGRPMYLAEVRFEKASFRLWRCSQCNTSCTNEEEVSQA